MNEEQLRALLDGANKEIKDLHAKSLEEIKNIGAVANDTKTALEALRVKHEELQKQLNAVDEKMQAAQIKRTEGKSLLTQMQESAALKHLVEHPPQSAKSVPLTSFMIEGPIALEMIGHKTALTSENVGGRTVTGVIPIERDSGITLEARRELRIRDILASRPTTARIIDFVKVDSPMSNAAEQSPEGTAKSENAVTFTSLSEEVRTIATWIPVSTQMLSDWGELENFLRTTLAYYLAKEVDENLLYATGAGSSIHGLIPQATAFDNGLLPTNGAGSYTPIDIIGWAAGQIAIANEIPPSFVVLHPEQWWQLRLTKDTQGRYILGDPWSNGVPDLFGMTPVPTTAIANGTFLVGSGNPAAAEVRPRMEITIAIGEQHSEYFTKNLVAIRAEMRLACVTKRPASFITGSLTTSPA